MLSVINLSIRKPHECVFCQASFNRPDALKRHWRTCKTRLERSLEIPQILPKARGRKSKACDRCHNSKKACVSTTSNGSCKSCIENNAVCSYKRRNSHREGHQEKRQELLSTSNTTHLSNKAHALFNPANQQTVCSLVREYTIGTTQIRRPSEMDFSELAKFPYLGNLCTTSGIANTFECGTSQYRLFIRQKMPFYEVNELAEAKPLSLQEVFQPEINDRVNTLSKAPWTRPRLGIGIPLPSLNLIMSDQDITTLRRSCEIVEKLRNAIINKKATSNIQISWSESTEATCLQFFSPMNIERYLTLFWFAWHPNCPFIHRPSFNSTTSHLNLVIAMTIIGACISPVESDRTMANVWFDVIEEMVFNDQVFSPIQSVGINEEFRTSFFWNCLSTLQAGYCVCLYQTWEGSKENKRRVRRDRYEAIIWLARKMGLRYATLDTVSAQNMTEFDWHEFIARESLIRIFSWIFNLDSAYALFFQQPPRMFVQEADMDLPSPEACFQAESAEKCFIALKSWRARIAPQRNIKLCDALRAICTETVRCYENFFSNMGVVGMFTIMSAFCALTFQTRHSMSPILDESTLRRGLHNWRRLWPSHIRDLELSQSFAHSDPNRWKTLGFVRHAPEYWLLTSWVLEQTTGRSQVTPDTSPVNEDPDMKQLNVLIVELRDQNNNASKEG